MTALGSKQALTISDLKGDVRRIPRPLPAGLASCGRCGAVLADEKTHEDWHARHPV